MKIDTTLFICTSILVCIMILSVEGVILNHDNPYNSLNTCEPRSDNIIEWRTVLGANYEYELTITEQEFMDSMYRPIMRATVYGVCATEPFITPDDPHIKALASYLYDLAGTDYWRAQIALNFTQCAVEYADDRDTYNAREHWAFPIETLYIGKGDCEDKAFLYCSILLAMGLDAVLIDEENHIGVGLSIEPWIPNPYTIEYAGKSYYSCHTTPSEPTYLYLHVPCTEPYKIIEPDDEHPIIQWIGASMTGIRYGASTYLALYKEIDKGLSMPLPFGASVHDLL